MRNKLGFPEIPVPVLARHDWGGGVARFQWSDGTVDEVRCTMAECMLINANINKNGGLKLAGTLR